MRHLVGLAVIGVCTLFFSKPSFAELREYDSKYYTIHTDLDEDDVKEAIVRMTRMAEEYHERTKGFSGVIRTKFPFYLFRSPADYYSHGGSRGTTGVFIYDASGERLLAIAGRKTTLETWHVVQHEGFHQFAFAVIGGNIPTWLNEGLAEYFGESIFTGDGFVTGLVPPWRLERLKREIQDGQLKSARDIMKVTSEEWFSDMNIRNYDQAWSMVHFLVHGENGKYQAAFSTCIGDISRGRSFDAAWADSIGSIEGFEERWKQYWLSQPPSPTPQLYARATMATLTSFLARATAQRQTFTDYNAFRVTAEAEDIHINPDDWLPQSLLTTTLRNTNPSRKVDLHLGDNKLPELTTILSDGTRLTGSFTLRGSRVEQVTVNVDDLLKVVKTAQALIDNGGKKNDARAMVQAALRANPKSPALVDARKFLQGLK